LVDGLLTGAVLHFKMVLAVDRCFTCEHRVHTCTQYGTVQVSLRV
jgi:hypothetical protein